MDEDGGAGGGFNGSEAIPAVQEEDQFYGDEEEYGDLYNDVNIGEGFYQSLHSCKGPEKAEAPILPPPERIQIPMMAVNRNSDLMSLPSSAQPPILSPLPAPLSVIRPDLAPIPNKPIEMPGFQVNNFSQEGLQRRGVLGNPNFCGVGGRGGNATLFVADLHWWTTDAELETELCKYGQVKEVRFFDEKACGKSKGYCQVDFYDPMAATACKEGMNGHVFNGRACVVAFSSPQSVRRMGESQMNPSLPVAEHPTDGPAGGPKGDVLSSGPQMVGNFARGAGGCGGNWVRNGGTGNRGPIVPLWNRMGLVGGRGIVNNGGFVRPPPILQPGNMLGQGFNPSAYGPSGMSKINVGYGGFQAGAAGAPFPGMLPSFQTVVAPHLNPAFFGRGMWGDPNNGACGGEEHSSYGEDGNAPQDRRHEIENTGHGHEQTECRHRDEREQEKERERERDRERPREKERTRGDRDKYPDDRDRRHGEHHRCRERETERGDDRERSSRTRSRSRDLEHSKRRRLSPR